MNITDKETIVRFLDGTGTDHILRTYDELLSETDEQMEVCHDAIQWLFPLHEFSKHARTCPVVSLEVVDEAKQYDAVRDNLLKAKDRMEKFFAIGEYEDIDKQRKWCKDRDHNLLRVTRIIRCLRLFGMDTAAKDFYDKVRPVGVHFGISDFSLGKWDQAYTNDIWGTLQN